VNVLAAAVAAMLYGFRSTVSITSSGRRTALSRDDLMLSSQPAAPLA